MRLLVPMVCLSLGCAAASAADPPSAEVGKPAPDFTLTDLEGKEHTLSAHRGKTVVLEWFNPGCPFVQHTHEPGGSLATLARDAAADGVVWLAINSGSPGKQGHGRQVNAKAAEQWSMGHPLLLDESGDVGRAYGAVTTPHMYVIDAEGVLRYAGAIDNAPMGKANGTFVNYVTKALDEMKAGKPVATPRTKPYGCSVKY